MSNRRGLVISIAGAAYSIGTHASLTGVTGYAATVRPVIMEIPPAQTVSIDVETGGFDAGGVSVRCRDLSGLLEQFKADPKTSLVNEESKISTTWDVQDTTGFTPPFTAWIGQECVQVGGVTAGAPGQFTFITRNTLGTQPQRHRPGKKVYSYMPTIEGRKVVCEWVDLLTGVRYARYVGQVERVDMDGESYVLVITSLLKGVSTRKVLRKQYAQGQLIEDLPANQTPDFYIQCDDKSRIFVDNANTGHDTAHILIGDEVIETPQVIYPAEQNEVINVISTFRLEVIDNLDIQPGWLVDVVDSSGNVVVEGALCVGRTTATPTSDYLDFNTDVSAAVVGNKVSANYHVLVPGLRIKRGAEGTEQQDHSKGTNVDEIRIVEGNQVDILLRLLFSDEGDGSNGPSGGVYDYYPEGWGLALPSDFVDLQELLDLKIERSDFRRYRQQEPIELAEYLRLLGIYCNASVYWREDGSCSATIRRDIYPLDTGGFAITKFNQDVKPNASLDLALIRNFWEVKTDWNIQGDRFRHVLTIEDIDSTDLRGQIPIEDADDFGLIKNVADAQIYTAAKSFLLLRASPLLMVRCSIAIDESNVLRPGMVVAVQLANLPNLQGSEGILANFEILEVSPSDGSGWQDVVLMQRPTGRKVGHVAISGRVASVGGGIVTLESSALSHFSPITPLFEPPGGTGQTGSEDVHWFLENDPIRFLDVSTFGSGPVTSLQTTIAAINYPALQFTPAVVPGWLAAGDLVRLDNYTAVGSGATSAFRVDIFLAIADGTVNPAILFNGATNDPAYMWGM